jgi:hypothetical protein
MRAIRTRPDGHNKEKTSWADGLGRKGFTLAGLGHLDLSGLPGAVRIAPRSRVSARRRGAVASDRRMARQILK